MATPDELVDRIKSALVENLMLVYPQGPPVDQAQIQKWLRELVRSTSDDDYDELDDDDDDNNDDDDRAATRQRYQAAVVDAVAEWKRRSALSSATEPPQKQKAKSSFSLLSQLGGAAAWGPPFAVESLQAETATPAEKLAILRKVAHVDDVVMDWHDVQPILRQGLIQEPQQQAFLQLHRAWFDQCRASNELVSIRCDLCKNLVHAIVKDGLAGRVDPVIPDDEAAQQSFFITGIRSNTSHVVLCQLWTMWKDMWIDLMQQASIYYSANGTLESMGRCVLLLQRWVNTSSKSSSRSPTTTPAFHCLAMVDPGALWFRHWATLLKPQQLVRLMEKTQILPTLMERASVFCTSGQDVPAAGSNGATGQLDLNLGQHSLSILACVLATTRVRLFPVSLMWDEHNDAANSLQLKPSVLVSLRALDEILLKDEDPSSTTDNGDFCDAWKHVVPPSCLLSEEQSLQLFQLFFSAAARRWDANHELVVDISGQAIEALLWGSPVKDRANKLWEQCEQYILGNGSSDQHRDATFQKELSRVLQCVGRGKPS